MMDEAQYWVEKSCSTSRRSCEQDSEDDQIIALMLSKEYAKLDGKRLSNFAPIPVRILVFLCYFQKLFVQNKLNFDFWTFKNCTF